MAPTPYGAENGSSSFPEAETVDVNGEQTVIIDTTVIGSGGGSSDSSSSVVESAKLDDDVSQIKEEDAVIGSPPVGLLPKAVEGLHEMGPTPFLRKTYEIVDEAITDPIVSWSSTQNSFIIWDSYKFSEDLLPKYFKHNNFSSFIRQLNTYGFKKVDPDRWEFANEGFQRGNKNLLKNIKRRSKAYCNKDADIPLLETETEVESLKKDQSSMRFEILKLKQEHEESHHQMLIVQEKINGVESKQQHMLSFFARLANDQRFVERLMRKRKFKQQRELEANEFIKKLKFLQNQENQEKLLDVENNLIIRKELNMAATQSILESNNMMNYESGIPRNELPVGGMIGGSKAVVDASGRDSNIYTDLEGLIGKEWGDESAK